MCGIVGLFSFPGSNYSDTVSNMALTLQHRGPDAGGNWSDPSKGIHLGHRRLSIIDLSNQGGQPMVSHAGRYIISFNGEIYNVEEIRTLLDSHGINYWNGHSDTEVLICAIERWGLNKTLPMLNGMFAFALWDRKHNKLTITRDRMGEKPLYIGWLNNKIAFSSELKAFNKIEGWRGSIDQNALSYLLRFGYIPAPLSIYQGIFKLPAATFLTLNNQDVGVIPTTEAFLNSCQCYWQLPDICQCKSPNKNKFNTNSVLPTLNELLLDSINLRMVADVPVGSLLSGGIDSTLVTTLMQKQSSKPVKTFTIGFNETEYDEAQFAKPLAKYLGTDHTEVILTAKDALEVIPNLPNIYDEPFADSSQIPTFLISKVASQHVTVALSGDGGDELFGGYHRYWIAQNIWKKLRLAPVSLRVKLLKSLSHLIHPSNNPQINRLHNTILYRLWRLSTRLSADTFLCYYSNLLSMSLIQTTNFVWPTGLPLLLSDKLICDTWDIERQMMFIDQNAYLPDDILVKTDRASMAVSLELRAPLLDHRIVEFSWKIPRQLRRKGKTGKLILNHLLELHVPKDLINRPKKGFEIPIEQWLRGPLKNWMLDLLSPESLQKTDYFNYSKINLIMDSHIKGIADHGYTLWPILMFQSWLNNRK